MIGPVTGTRAVIAAATLLLGLSACSGEDPDPQVAPPSPTEPSTTGTSAETPPEMPEAAKGTDAAAAEAFVKFYWETVNYAQQSGDLAGLREISSDKCIACQAGIDYLEDVFAKNGEFTGGVGRVSNPTAAFATNAGITYAVVDFDLALTRQRVDFPGTDEDEAYTGGSNRVRARLEPTSSGWIMDYWDEL